jgi:hypothetical protein
MAVAANGSVFVLDDAARRVMRLRESGKRAETVMSLPVAPTSLALTDGGRIAYIAHSGGLLRVDLQTKTTAEVGTPAEITLAGVQWIRWHRSSLIGMQQQPDGSRAVLRWRLVRGQRVSEAVVIDTPGSGDVSPATIVGDDLYYPVMTPANGTNASGVMTITVRRVRLPR